MIQNNGGREKHKGKCHICKKVRHNVQHCRFKYVAQPSLPSNTNNLFPYLSYKPRPYMQIFPQQCLPTFYPRPTISPRHQANLSHVTGALLCLIFINYLSD